MFLLIRGVRNILSHQFFRAEGFCQALTCLLGRKITSWFDRAMRNPVFIEAALNGPWSKSRQPLMPVSADALIAEGIDCARAGAAVIHIHVYDPDTGTQFEDVDAYRRVIEGIRQVHDVIVYPTLPLSGFGDTGQHFLPETRFAAVAALAKAGLLEWSVIDPGTTQITALDADRGEGVDFLYINSTPEIRYGLELAARYDFVPSFAIYEPGFLRLGAMLSSAIKGCPRPVYRFMFSDRFSFGFPAEEAYLRAYKTLLDGVVPNAMWMAAGLQVNLDRIVPLCLSLGGHLRTGLEDAIFYSDIGNAGLVEKMAAQVQQENYEIGTPAQLRQKLKTP